MRADIHDGPEQMLQSKAGYIDARPLTASSAKPLATHGRTIHLGQNEKNSMEQMSFRVTRESGHRSIQPACLKRAKTRSLQRLGSCSASSVDVGGSIPSPPTTAGPRHARVSNIWSPAGRSTTCICSDSPHHRGWHICLRNLRLDPHIAARLSLLLPVS